MNELAAKIVKAEIMGNAEQIAKLKEKIERARKYRSEHKEKLIEMANERRQEAQRSLNRDDENVLLTTTNSKGVSRPVTAMSNESDKWGGKAGRKVKKQKIETHLDGERVNYFGDDRKYDLKQLVNPKFFAFVSV